MRFDILNANLVIEGKRGSKPLETMKSESLGLETKEPSAKEK